MKRKKRAIVQKPEERAEGELRPEEREGQPQDRIERIEAELASQKPGAAGLTVRSKRPKC